MIYKLDPNRENLPLLYWNYLFAGISTKLFTQVYDKLDFPFSPPEMLRQIAHDYVIAQELLYREPVPEKASINFLEGILPDDPYPKKCELLFTNTFLSLEKEGYGEIVYQWGKQTHDYYLYSDVEVLHTWCRLLRVWVLQEWLKQPFLTLEEPFLGAWENIVTQMVDQGWNTTQLFPLNLPVISRSKTQVIIVSYEANLRLFSQTRKRFMESPKSTWDDFALRNKSGETWIGQEGYFRNNLHEWNAIQDTLSPEEMSILEQWAIQHQSQFRDLVGTVPKLRKWEK